MRKFLLTAALCGAAFAIPANAAELLTNGDFETGTFAGWTVSDLPGGNGTWFTDTPGTTGPASGFTTAPNANGGAFYALTDQNGPGTHALLQTFIVPIGATMITLSFEMFANDQSGAGPIVNPAGLDHTAGPNQHARVDILSGAAGDFDTGAGVVGNFYLGVDAGVDPNPYTLYSFNVTGLLTAGMTYRLRFAEVDNQLFFQQGVDNVSIDALVGVPEPGALGLLGLGIAGLALRRRRA